MPKKPNILFLMTDQMQGRVLEHCNPCQTPHLDKLAARGVRFTRAYTPNPVCSPARASLMTGLLPHNHGVLWVTHNVDPDQGLLRLDKPHWAQNLGKAGYQTGYFGKWHVEHSERPTEFGWQTDGSFSSSLYKAHTARRKERLKDQSFLLEKYLDQPAGYDHRLLYAVTSEPPEERSMGLVTSLATSFLEEALASESPWCCFVSLSEPHDPFIAGTEAFARYDVSALELPPNAHHDLTDRPALYRKAARAFAHLSEHERQEAMASYYASITEMDQLFGQLLEKLELSNQLDNTIMIVTSDHGEMLGALGLYCKNISAAEEAYHIPLVMAGPGIAQGETCNARVGLHELAPTLLELAGAEPLPTVDGQTFTEALRAPIEQEKVLTAGYAEYHGGRYLLTQRVYWEGDWKFIFNGFDFDELYNLKEDPFELHNLALLPEHEERVQYMMYKIWQKIREADDRSLLESHYPILRLGTYGPLCDPVAKTNSKG